MSPAIRLTRAGLSFLVFAIVVTILPSSGNALATTGSCAPADSIYFLGITSPTVIGGKTDTGSVTMTLVPGTTISVPITSNNGLVSVTSASVPSNSPNGGYSLTTQAVSTPTTVILTATYDGSQKTTELTLEPPAITSQSISGYTGKLTSGKSFTYTVTLSGVAPSGGIRFPISNSDPSALSGPSTITIPGGSTTGSVTFTDTYTGGGNGSTVSISAPGVSGEQVWVD